MIILLRLRSLLKPLTAAIAAMIVVPICFSDSHSTAEEVSAQSGWEAQISERSLMALLESSLKENPPLQTVDNRIAVYKMPVTSNSPDMMFDLELAVRSQLQPLQRLLGLQIAWHDHPRDLPLFTNMLFIDMSGRTSWRELDQLKDGLSIALQHRMDEAKQTTCMYWSDVDSEVERRLSWFYVVFDAQAIAQQQRPIADCLHKAIAAAFGVAVGEGERSGLYGYDYLRELMLIRIIRTCENLSGEHESIPDCARQMIRRSTR